MWRNIQTMEENQCEVTCHHRKCQKVKHYFFFLEGPVVIKMSSINIMFTLLFRFSHFHHFSGRTGEDAMGGGVMCQVLLEAIHLASNGIVEDMDNGDGYLSLKISQDSIVDKGTLDCCFALNALCTIFLVKTHSAPDLISLILLQAVTGGFFSIVDLMWVWLVSPAAAAVLELLPTYANEPIPHHPSLESLVHSRFPWTTVSCFQPKVIVLVNGHSLVCSNTGNAPYRPEQTQIFDLPQDFAWSTGGGTGEFIRIEGLFLWDEYLFDTSPAFIQRGIIHHQLTTLRFKLADLIGFLIGNPMFFKSYAIRMLLLQNYLTWTTHPLPPF